MGQVKGDCTALMRKVGDLGSRTHDLPRRVGLQNTSHAVMAQRVEPKDSPDDFPTPPWATRALVEHVLKNVSDLAAMTCLEPACGVGHMAKVLKEYFGAVYCCDAYPYGYGHEQDFLTCPFEDRSFDWVITNPPFRLAMPFILRAIPIARCGVAVLARTVFLESVGRYTGTLSTAASFKICAIHGTCTDFAGTIGLRCNHSDGLRMVYLGKERDWSVTPYVGATVSPRT